MPLFSDPYSSVRRPVLRGVRGAVAAAHPLAAAAGQRIIASGGNAVDALIAAQAVLTVIAPDACGIGGDMLALVAPPGDEIQAVSGVGRSSSRMAEAALDGGASVTVPGLVGGWIALSRRWGSTSLSHCLEDAILLARNGFALTPSLHHAVEAQRGRLQAGGAGKWVLLQARPGDRVTQPQLADLLTAIGRTGGGAFYEGASAMALEAAVAAHGGSLGRADLAAHDTPVGRPVAARAGEWSVSVQPPPTQGVLLAMALQARAPFGAVAPDLADHLHIELTEAAFASRSDCGEGATLLARTLDIDPGRAGHRGGPRAYLHTAGVCASDAAGLTVASLVSVFDDFGSGVFVPELGIVLNNRAAGFTDGANAPGPAKRPVHTLAPAILRRGAATIALATPGADGQVQTLLQIIGKLAYEGLTLDEAVAAPRWRSEGGRILIERDHASIAALARRDHQLRELDPGDMRFGALVAAGHADARPFALADWRRECWSGVA